MPLYRLRNRCKIIICRYEKSRFVFVNHIRNQRFFRKLVRKHLTLRLLDFAVKHYYGKLIRSAFNRYVSVRIKSCEAAARKNFYSAYVIIQRSVFRKRYYGSSVTGSDRYAACNVLLGYAANASVRFPTFFHQCFQIRSLQICKFSVIHGFPLIWCICNKSADGLL